MFTFSMSFQIWATSNALNWLITNSLNKSLATTEVYDKIDRVGRIQSCRTLPGFDFSDFRYSDSPVYAP